MKLPKFFDSQNLRIGGHKVPLAVIAILVAIAGIIIIKRGGLGTARDRGSRT